MAYREYDADAAIYADGDTPENFYVVLSGTVGELRKNGKIEDWDWARGVYSALLEWKVREFDVKVREAIRKNIGRIKKEADEKTRPLLDRLISAETAQDLEEGALGLVAR